MSSENVRERKERHRYTFVIVPDVKAEKTRTFSVTRLGLIVATAGFLVIFALMVLAVIVYTPLGEKLPVTNKKLEVQYGRQIADIQRQMHLLLQGINTLRGYNLRLRRAMGEKITPADSLALVNFDRSYRQSETSGSSPGSGEESAGVPKTSGDYPAGRYAGILQAGNTRESNRTVQPVQFPLTQPVDGFVTREFNSDEDHFGIDFAGRPKSPVLAAADGIVVFAGWTYDDGYVLMLAHSAGFISVYKHNQSLLRSVGDGVRRGEIIALLGSTGQTSTGPHLHFEVWRDGVAQDPANYLLTIQ